MWDYLFWFGDASFAFHPIRLQDSFIISICEKNQVKIVFVSWRKSLKEVSTWDYCFFIGFGPWCFSYRLQDSLISNKTWKNQLISLIFCMVIFIKGRWYLRLPLLGGCGQVCLGVIKIPELFDHRHLWKEIIDTFDDCQSFLFIYFLVGVHLLMSKW